MYLSTYKHVKSPDTSCHVHSCHTMSCYVRSCYVTPHTYTPWKYNLNILHWCNAFCHMSCNVTCYFILHIMLYHISSHVKCHFTSDFMSCHVKYQVECSILNVKLYKVISYPAWVLRLHNGLEGYLFLLRLITTQGLSARLVNFSLYIKLELFTRF